MRKNLEKGRAKGVLPRDENEAAGKELEPEERLKDIAQRGIIKIFNAFRTS